MAYTASYYVVMTNWGNPDMGQDPQQGVPGTERPTLLHVDSWEEASRICRDYIARNELGGGNWPGGLIYDAQNHQVVANVSYNGRVWEGHPDDWTDQTECLYNP